MIEKTEGPDFGKALDSALIERGLRELCPGLHFDLAAATGQLHPYIHDRQGVYYDGKHICAMDRATIPEYKIWAVSEVVVPIPWHAADEEMASIKFEMIPRDHPEWPDLYAKAVRGSDPEYILLNDGKDVGKAAAFSVRKRPSFVIKLGWRHTFEALVRANLPGITRFSLSRKFGIDMFKFPMGTPEEVAAALHAE